MKHIIWILLIVLTILHQDYWQWDRTELVAGFLPYTLAYHVAISLAATVLWLLATKFCWPEGLETLEQESRPANQEQNETPT